MASNPNIFLSHLKESGLLAADQLAEVRSRIDGASVDDAISGMVQRGWLTEFQVKQLHAGQSKGLVLGQYHILDELGRGGYGCVYKARHQLMDRVVALKVIAPNLVADSRARTWFRREVFAATQLNHPNIVMAYDADEVDDILFFAMEYVDGFNLESLVRKRSALPIGMACELLNQSAKALQYAHEKGMVHRDIKPANMLIPKDVFAETPPDPAAARAVMVKIVDFGLARLHKASPHQTLMLQSEKSFVGTPAFVSPEQARNVHDVDIRSDLYSLGCTLYFALAGRAPFTGDSVFELLAHHLESEAEPIERCRREVPPALASIVRRLMAKNPAKRFQTPAELIGELGFFFSTDRGGLNRPAAAYSLPQEFRPINQLVPARTPEPVPNYIGPITANQPTDFKSADVSISGIYPATAIVEHPDSSSADRLIATNLSLPLEVVPVVRMEQKDAETPQKAERTELEHSPPLASGTLAIDDNLKETWSAWAGIVETLAKGDHPAIDDTAYRQLQKKLLEQCHFQLVHAAKEVKPLYQQMADFVKPWLSLGSFPIADRVALLSLHTRCKRFNEVLGLTDGRGWQWAIGFVLFGVAIVLGWFVLQELPAIRATAALKPQTLIQEHPFLLLAAAAPVIAAMMFFFVIRRLRRA